MTTELMEPPRPAAEARKVCRPPSQSARLLGATLLRLCGQGRRECSKPNCWLQPFCECARADFAAARRLEGRVWTLIAICGAVVIAFAAIWAVW